MPVKKDDLHNSFVRSVTYDLASIATATTADVSVTVPDVVLGSDYVELLEAPAALNAGLIVSHCRVTANNTVSMRVGNVTAGALDAASGTWVFLVHRR